MESATPNRDDSAARPIAPIHPDAAPSNSLPAHSGLSGLGPDDPVPSSNALAPTTSAAAANYMATETASTPLAANPAVNLAANLASSLSPDASAGPVVDVWDSPPAPRGSSISNAPSSHQGDATVLTRRPPLLGADGNGVRGLALGQSLDHFVIRQLVGEGGMGAVYRAFDTLLQREVAIKILHADSAADDDIVSRFQQEAQSAARLRHPHIAAVYHFGETDDWRYIVFEFVEGRNLRELVRSSGPLAWQDSLRIVREATSALDHAHRRGVVHRDIKPSNLILTAAEGVKVVDMGLARLRDKELGQQDLTASGMTLGTFDYISPEQARDPRDADVRSDLYSLGCSWYFLLTGTPPFPEGSPLQKLLQHQGDLAPDPRDRRPDLPLELAAILARLLAKNPSDRYQRPADLARDLDALAHQHALDDAAISPMFDRTPTPSRPSPWSWAVPFVGLAVFLGFMEWNARLNNRPREDERLKSQAFRAAPELVDPAARKTPRLSVDVPWAASEEGDLSGLGVLEQAEKYVKPLKNSSQREATLATKTPSGKPSEVNSGLPGSVETARLNTDGFSGAKSPRNPSGVLRTVSPSPNESAYAYGSLSQALVGADDGTVIELDFDGRKVESPCVLEGFTLANAQGRRVLIRPAAGRKPVIVFRPASTANASRQLFPADPQGDPPADQITLLEGASLEFRNLHIELLLPTPRSAFPVNWNLIAVHSGGTVRLSDCSVTITRPAVLTLDDGGETAFVDVRNRQTSLVSPTSRYPSQVTLENCVVRGNAVLMHQRKDASANLWWKNGFFSSTNYLVQTEGKPLNSASEPECNVHIEHITTVCPGLFRMRSAQGAGHPLTAIVASGCVFAGLPDSPWIEVAGSETESLKAAGEFRWESLSPNLFVGIKSFLRFWPGESVYDLNYAEWKAQFVSAEMDEVNAEDSWKVRRIGAKPAELAPSDFQVTQLPFFDVLPGDVQAAGCRLQALPALPSAKLQ